MRSLSRLFGVAHEHDTVSRDRAPLSAQLRLTVSAFGLVAHVLVVTHYVISFRESPLPASFLHQFTLLVGVSACCVVAVSLCRGTIPIGSLLALQLFCVLVATAPIGMNLLVKMLLYGSLLVEIAVVQKHHIRMTMTGACIVLIMFSQREMVVWGIRLEPPPLTEWFTLALCLIAIGTVSLYSRRLAEEVQRYRVSLEESRRRAASLLLVNQSLQQHGLVAQIEAASDERKRITRDIHDTICYAFSCIIMMMNDSNIAAQDDDLQRVLQLSGQTIRVAKDGLADVRASLHLFREIEQNGPPLFSRLMKLTNAFSAATGTHVQLHFGDLPAKLDRDVDEAIQRLVQEALANSVRHSNSRSMDITFGVTDTELIVVARDDGSGAEQVHEGIGLTGMRERVERIGGTFAALASAAGFSVSARFPLSSALASRRR